jgi:ABC-type nitrate/sulfonate/bicarbonate transport system permease component
VARDQNAAFRDVNWSIRRSICAQTLLGSARQMVRNMPAPALIPLVTLWFGIDEWAKLFLAALGVFFSIHLNTSG